MRPSTDGMRSLQQLLRTNGALTTPTTIAMIAPTACPTGDLDLVGAAGRTFRRLEHYQAEGVDRPKPARGWRVRSKPILLTKRDAMTEQGLDIQGGIQRGEVIKSEGMATTRRLTPT